jgi:protein-L-isoaspartate(D-aspartate) O-methyltransferase
MAISEAAGNRADADSAERRLKMVNGQLRTQDVTDAAVLKAILTVPRERFVAQAFAKHAYLDQDIPASGGSGRKLLAPRTVGRLLQAAAVKPGNRALEVGGGSGYGAALLSELGAFVVAVESEAGAVAATRAALAGYGDVKVIQGGLDKGAPDLGPFDVILLNGAFEIAPLTLIDQLAAGGRLVGLDARSASRRAVLIEKTGTGTSERSLFDASGDVLPGFAKTPSFSF